MACQPRDRDDNAYLGTEVPFAAAAPVGMIDDPALTFTEWASDADQRAYERL